MGNLAVGGKKINPHPRRAQPDRGPPWAGPGPRSAPDGVCWGRGSHGAETRLPVCYRIIIEGPDAVLCIVVIAYDIIPDSRTSWHVTSQRALLRLPGKDIGGGGGGYNRHVTVTVT